jgi:hypothetical protein
MAGPWSVLNDRLGADVTGLEIFAITYLPASSPYNATTISFDETDNSINDSASGMPVPPVGAVINVSGATDAQAELNADHVIVSATASKWVVETDITAAEAAGASVTVKEIKATFRMTLDELAAFVGEVAVPVLSDDNPQDNGTPAPGTSPEASRADHTHQMPSKADVGLGSVDDTSDADKPVSTAQQASLDGKLAKDGGTVVTVNEATNTDAGGALDWATAMSFIRTIAADTTISFTNKPTSVTTKRELVLNGADAYVMTWPGTEFAWEDGGSEPPLTSKHRIIFNLYADSAVVYARDGGSLV